MGSDRLYPNALAVAALACGLLLAGPVGAEQRADPANEALEAARDDLRISRVTFDRVKNRFYELLEPESFDPAVLADYAVYMERVGALMERQQRIVAEMEAIVGVAPPAAAVGDWPTVVEETFDPGLPAADDALARLDRELDASLAEFDQFLLDEQYEALRRMRELEDASAEEMTDLAREAAAAVERLRDRGIDVDTKNPSDQQAQGQGQQGQAGGGGGAGGSDASGGGGGQGAPGEPGGGGAGQTGEEGASGAPGQDPGEGQGAGAGGTAQEGQGGAGGGEGGEQSGGQSGQPGGGGGSGSGGGGSGDSEQPRGAGGTGGGEDPEPKKGPETRAPAADDDIVARQLREAAERETDPELKKKLWEEYDRYKGTSGDAS